MGNVKQLVLLQQEQSVFIECEIGTIITHNVQYIQTLQIAAQTILFAEMFKVYLRQLQRVATCPEGLKQIKLIGYHETRAESSVE